MKTVEEILVSAWKSYCKLGGYDLDEFDFEDFKGSATSTLLQVSNRRVRDFWHGFKAAFELCCEPPLSDEKLSNCCGVPPRGEGCLESGICPNCKEHCDFESLTDGEV